MKRYSPSPLPLWALYHDMPWVSAKVVSETAKHAKLSYESWMQDWPVEVCDEIDLLRVLELAEQEERPEYLAAYLSMLLLAMDNLLEPTNHPLLVRIEKVLMHYPEVISYWLLLDEDDGNDSTEAFFTITPWLRQLMRKYNLHFIKKI